MINKENLRILISADVQKMTAGLNKASKELSDFGNRVNKVGRNLSLKLTAPILAAGTMAVKSASDFQRLRTTLEVLTGSADKGRKVFEKLVKFSAQTPFQLPDLVEVNNMLMGFGLNADQAYESLKLLGDIAAVSGGDLKNIARAFGQSAGAGRVMTQDINQFINNAVPLYDMLAGVTGKNVSQLREMASQGEITFDLLVQSFKKATSEGGKFNNGMQRLSQTFAGQLSTFRDQLNITFAKFGEIILPLLTRLLKRLSSLADTLKNLSPETKKLTLLFGGFLAALGPAAYVIGGFAKGLSFLSKSFKLILSVVPFVTRAMQSLFTLIIANPITLLVTGVAAVGVALIEVLHKLNPLVSRFETFINLIKSGGSPTAFMTNQALSMAKSQKIAAKEQADLNKELKEFKDRLNDALPEVDGFEQAFGNLGAETIKVRDKIAAVNEITSKGIEWNGDQTQKGLAVFGNGIKKITTDLSELQKISKNTSHLVTIDFGNMAIAAAQTFGTALIEGKNIFQTIGSIILTTIGDILIQMGTAAVAASKLSATFAIPGIGAAAGLAAIALGAIVKGFSSKMRASGPAAFADGGIISGPTLGLMGEYTGARSNPEVVAPLNKLKTMIGNSGGGNVQVSGEFKLRGQDLVVALQRANKERNRIL